MNHNLNAHWLGRVDYLTSLNRQNDFVRLATEKNMLSILGVEHSSVITLGLRGMRDDILVDESVLARKNIPVYKVRRGGMVAVHSLGQTLIYPIIPIRKLKIKAKHFVDIIINSTVQTLNYFGCITEFDYDRRGFYTDRGKIAFLGLQFKRGVSMHGVAINVNNNLDLLRMIRPCGIDNENFDKLSNYQQVSLTQVFGKWFDKFTSFLDISQ